PAGGAACGAMGWADHRLAGPSARRDESDCRHAARSSVNAAVRTRAGAERYRPGRRRTRRGAGESRTHTGTDLNRVPLPLGYGPAAAASLYPAALHLSSMRPYRHTASAATQATTKSATMAYPTRFRSTAPIAASGPLVMPSL